ncbi:hypothetical protein [Bacillus alkalicellulosilyticus]|uniref:hypothetical protein n=1 Tax=Alkalihalobacterium alkalicellulosilyticum TaxID=1912214 RepID=UPI00099649D6|nr:hypothetical protein [Bacillus alkalicellulosilyticus]
MKQIKSVVGAVLILFVYYWLGINLEGTIFFHDALPQFYVISVLAVSYVGFHVWYFYKNTIVYWLMLSLVPGILFVLFNQPPEEPRGFNIRGVMLALLCVILVGTQIFTLIVYSVLNKLKGKEF